MNKLFVVSIVFLAQSSFASVCDIGNDGSNYYDVTRDGNQFSEWTTQGDFSSAIKTRDQLLSSGVCTVA